MAEVRISWADGRMEVRSILPAQVLTVGDARKPLIAEAIPLGKQISLAGGRVSVPFCRVRLYGDEIPTMTLHTKSSREPLLLPSARSRRFREFT